MDIGKALTLKFDGTKSVKITRVHEDGVMLEWVTEAGAARQITEIALTNAAIINTAALLSEYVSRLHKDNEENQDA